MWIKKRRLVSECQRYVNCGENRLMLEENIEKCTTDAMKRNLMRAFVQDHDLQKSGTLGNVVNHSSLETPTLKQ